jgi:hypothetical protein
MIDERLPPDVKVDDLFEPGEMRGSILPFDYIVKQTFLRPREVIQFLKECIHRAGRESIEIEKDNVREAEERYSYWKVEDIKQEYRRLYPEFENILEALRQGVHRYDSVEEFEAFLQTRLPGQMNELGVRRMVQLLFNASVVGVRLGGLGSAEIPLRGQRSDFASGRGGLCPPEPLSRSERSREARAAVTKGRRVWAVENMGG